MTPEKSKWIEEVLNSIEGIQPAHPPVNFYSALMMKIRIKSSSPVKISIRMISGVAAALALLIGLNIFSWVSYCRAEDSSG